MGVFVRAVGTFCLAEKDVSGDNKRRNDRQREREGVVGRAEEGTKGGTRQGADMIKTPHPAGKGKAGRSKHTPRPWPPPGRSIAPPKGQ